MAGAAPETASFGGLGMITADMIRATFDHWRIFEKDDGRRRGPRSLICPLVCAMTMEGLAEQLSLQEWLRRMPAAELEAVWRDGFAAVRP
jgi:hypothetical protein